MYIHKCRGTCSTEIHLDVQDGIVTQCEIVNGCRGNTQGVSRLVIGRKADDVIAQLKGIPCHGDTSCPDQLARGLEEMKAQGLF